jgi:hypothetical protein
MIPELYNIFIKKKYLGPIPFIYCAEVFRQDARSTAMAIGMLANWTSGNTFQNQ